MGPSIVRAPRHPGRASLVSEASQSHARTRRNPMRRTRLIGAIACAVGALAALPPAAPAAVQVGSSGWQLGNPPPPGNTIRAMAVAGTPGDAAGYFGTPLRPTDAGPTWTGLPSGTFTAL